MRNRSGSVVGFVLVGVLLLALVAGGIYLIKNNLAPLATGQNEAQEVARESNDSSQKAAKEDKESKEENKDTSGSAGNQESQTPANNQPNSTPEAGTSSTDSNMPSTGVGTETLPQTGPVDALLTALGASVFIGVSIAYLRSYVARYGSL